MKKMLLLGIALALLTGCGKMELDGSVNNTTKYIGVDKAQEIVFNSVGLTISEVSNFEIELKNKSDMVVYEVEFIVANKSYEYVINAISGDIIEYSVDSEKEGVNSGKNNKDDYEKNEEKINELSGIEGISEALALNIALNDLSLTHNDLVFVKVYIVKYNGNFAYHVKFKSSIDYKEYDYIIDIATGNIVLSEIN